MAGWKLFQINNFAKLGQLLILGLVIYPISSYALSVSEVVERIVNNSPELKVILEKKEQALAVYKGAKSVYLPSIYFSYMRKYEKADPLNNPSISNWTGSNKFQFVLEQKIFDMNALASIMRNSYLVQSQDFENQKLLESLIQLAITAYYDVIQAEYIASVHNEYLVAIKNIEKLVYKMRNEGNATLADVNLIQSRVAEANTNVLTSNANLDKVRARLAHLLNLIVQGDDVVSAPGTVLPELTNKDFYDLADRMVSFLPITLHELQQEAIRNNVDILLLRSNLCAAGYRLEEQKARYLPTITANVTLKDEEQKSDTSISRTGKIEFETKYYLYDGGSRSAGLKNAESSIRELEYTYDIKIRDLRDKCYAAFNQLTNLGQQRASILKEIESSEEVDRVYRQQFKFATRNLIDRLDNIQRLLQARIKLINVDYNVLMSRIEVLMLQGHFVEFFGFQNYLDYNKLNLC